MTNSIWLFVPDSHSNISNEETFLQGFLVILKHFASELLGNLEEYFHSTACMVMSLTYSKFQTHDSVLPVSKGFKSLEKYIYCVTFV